MAIPGIGLVLPILSIFEKNFKHGQTSANRTEFSTLDVTVDMPFTIIVWDISHLATLQ
jgi:hypothetical protein